MAPSLKASSAGLDLVDRARQRRGWTKTSTARWWQDAHTSRATLRRFWQGERIQQDIFIAICQAVGIGDWQTIADFSASPDSSPAMISASPLLLDWNEAPDLESFYGRTQELQQLEQWMLTDRPKAIAITGLAGIGKTALALALADRVQANLQANFQGMIWRSLQAAPSLEQTLNRLLSSVEQPPVQSVAQGIAQFVAVLQQHPYLIILDSWDAILSSQENVEAYNVLLQKLLSSRHQSCIVITSREIPAAIEMNTPAGRILSLKGLHRAAALELVQTQGLSGQELGLTMLIQLYGGNPLALKLVVPLVQSLFGGRVAAFLRQNTLIVGDRLQSVLKQQVQHLSDLEQDLLYWLAIWQEPIAFSRLQSHLFPVAEPATVLVGLANLDRRSLLEKSFSSEEPCFTLQPLVMKVVGDQLVEQAVGEIQQLMQTQDIADLHRLKTHWLLRPGTDDLAGDRILRQIKQQLEQLHDKTYDTLMAQLYPLLRQLQDQPPRAIGYARCNLAALWQFLDGASPLV